MQVGLQEAFGTTKEVEITTCLLLNVWWSYYRSTFECMDVSPVTVTGGHTNQNGALFHHVEPRCGSLPCPPYEQQKEITCAVCSK